MESIRSIRLALLIAVTLLVASCKEYGDDLRDIGARVEALEVSAKKLNSDIDALSSIVKAIEGRLYITGVTKNGDGSCTLTFSDGNTKTLHRGKDGEPGNGITVTIAKDTDGVWYWKVNGDWLLDGAGDKIPAGGTDGTDGTAKTVLPKLDTDGNYYWTVDGEWMLDEGGKKVPVRGTVGEDGAETIVSIAQDTDGIWYWKVNGEWMLDADGGKVRANGIDGSDGSVTAAIPQMRVNSSGIWEVSTDGGATWTSTGVKADGEDGYDHTYDVVSDITVSADGSILTIVLADGTVISLGLL
ncbi:MAG: PL29 family lyase N-terminal domain-containing protein [Porphyromonas sp.]|nr:PL29 family lyase N-terminal domain-containing protein [Bacteroidales bacterium]MDY3101493.1 PL29 family lyase N-terminal domain-containing protein [Porphyromonas sp.]